MNYELKNESILITVTQSKIDPKFYDVNYQPIKRNINWIDFVSLPIRTIKVNAEKQYGVLEMTKI